MRKIIRILLIIVVTVGCICLGFHTRKNNAIVVTQLQTNSEESLSYLIETNKKNIIMIDGGSYEDSEHLEQVLQEKGGVVESWFITMAHPENFGAFQEILENGKVQINHIYISFNPADWYAEYEPERYAEIAEFLDLIYSEDIIKKVYDVPFRYELLVDNLYVSVLNVKNPELNGDNAGFNQSMVIKINNTYKSMIFMGNIANDAAQIFKDNNLDEINCDAIQISNNNQQKVSNEIYEKMKPMYIFMPVSKNSDANEAKNYARDLQNLLQNKETYLSCDGDVTVRIW